MRLLHFHEKCSFSLKTFELVSGQLPSKIFKEGDPKVKVTFPLSFWHRLHIIMLYFKLLKPLVKV